jgi:hypothetical protein
MMMAHLAGESCELIREPAMPNHDPNLPAPSRGARRLVGLCRADRPETIARGLPIMRPGGKDIARHEADAADPERVKPYEDYMRRVEQLLDPGK